mmetsp:Transcript_21353/g.25741  ORF Transcript_21353/g.25741 Transcript_21353/m.25741 type:complete len:319 (-) Transcript_21353:112-1068(-)
MYGPCHSIQGPITFIASICLVIPSLNNNKIASSWLRSFALLGIFAPIYLCSGLSKFRYLGLESNLSGRWLQSTLLSDQSRHLFPHINKIIAESKVLCSMLSLGNQFFEFVLPLAVFLVPSPLSILIFQFTALAFHISIFFFLGPNFIRMALVLILTMDPLGVLPVWFNFFKQRLFPSTFQWCRQYLMSFLFQHHYFDKLLTCKLLLERRFSRHHRDHEHVEKPNPSICAHLFRALYSMLILYAFLRIQFASDYSRLNHTIPKNQRYNPYFPIPEYSMFAKPSKNADFRLGFSLDLLVAAAIVSNFCFYLVPPQRRQCQ